MESRISRGAPEWSESKDLYMGSHIQGSEKVREFLVEYLEGSRRFRWWKSVFVDSFGGLGIFGNI